VTEQEKITDLIAKLLRKAEHKNTTEAEADAFYAKAQALMAQHAIDMLTVRAKMDAGAPDPLGALGCTVMKVTKSYVTQDAILIDGIARANDCRAQYNRQDALVYVYGYHVDRLNVELLFTSMSIVVSQQALKYGKASGLKGMKLYVARRSFRDAFGRRIGQRLAQAKNSTVAAVKDDSLLPALRDKVDAVEKYMPRGRKDHTRQNYDWEAARAGRHAANSADIGGARIGAAKKGALGR
jgi:hypothetical protein